jgi:hypothetical protein
MGDRREAYRVVMGESDENVPLGKPRHLRVG